MLIDEGVLLPDPGEGETWVVGAVIRDGRGRAFAQRRGPHRRLFPGCWDVVGGHVEPGETLLGAIAREIGEETGRRLRQVVRLLGVSSWTGDDGAGLRHEATFEVEVDGGLTHPTREHPQHTDCAWFTAADLPRLTENRVPGDTHIHDVIAQALG